MLEFYFKALNGQTPSLFFSDLNVYNHMKAINISAFYHVKDIAKHGALCQKMTWKNELTPLSPVGLITAMGCSQAFKLYKMQQPEFLQKQKEL